MIKNNLKNINKEYTVYKMKELLQDGLHFGQFTYEDKDKKLKEYYGYKKK